jgi:hypothetical protein
MEEMRDPTSLSSQTNKMPSVPYLPEAKFCSFDFSKAIVGQQGKTGGFQT